MGKEMRFSHAGDNGGPQSQKQAEGNIASALKIFPNARVIGAEEKEKEKEKEKISKKKKKPFSRAIDSFEKIDCFEKTGAFIICQDRLSRDKHSKQAVVLKNCGVFSLQVRRLISSSLRCSSTAR